MRENNSVVGNPICKLSCVAPMLLSPAMAACPRPGSAAQGGSALPTPFLTVQVSSFQSQWMVGKLLSFVQLLVLAHEFTPSATIASLPG